MSICKACLVLVTTTVAVPEGAGHAMSADAAHPAHVIRLAQAGSTGGTIGKQGKSISGGAEPANPATAPVAAPHAKPTRPAQSRAAQCPNITGVWNSWASGLFGKGDATFRVDGSAIHRSGIPGKWWCANGQLRIEWADGKPGAVRLSADGKQILSGSGSVHMSRD
jgi:hypothetical protein